MHHGIFPPWAEMQLEWDAAVRCDCVQMNLSALAPGAWVRPCDAHCLRWLSVQKRRGQVRGAHSPHKVAHLLSCDKCNQCRRSPRYFKWIRLPLKIDGGKLAKTSCHCWHKQEMGCCHYRNIQVKDRACKKKEEKMFRALSNGLDEAEMWGMHLGRDWAENVLFKVCCLPPPPRPLVVTQKSMRELWRIIIDESQGHYAVLKREASEVSSTNPPSSLSSVPIDLSGLYF